MRKKLIEILNENFAEFCNVDIVEAAALAFLISAWFKAKRRTDDDC